MNASPQPVAISPQRIHPDSRPGLVHLTVANLERQIAFYQKVIGFQLHWREGTSAGLGAGRADLLRLTEVRGARRYRGSSGLYHFAILLPSRRELARVIARLFDLRYPNSPTDHIMTKTTYLDDPEGNGIEIYTESPEDGIFAVQGDSFVARRADGTLSNGREALDVGALFAELSADEALDAPMPPETKIGHVHLHVANLAETMRFYHDLLGFDNMGLMRAFRMGMVSAGGYHHHIGFNTWAGEGAPPAPPDSVGLRWFLIRLPDLAELGRVADRVRQAGLQMEEREEGLFVRDPSRNGVMLTAGES